jgi:hypothetical protein
MKYVITLIAIIFVMAIVLYFLVFQGYDTVNQIDIFRSKFSGLVKTEYTQTLSGQFVESSWFADVGSTTSVIATGSGWSGLVSGNDLTNTSVTNPVDQATITSDTRTVVNDPLDDQVSPRQQNDSSTVSRPTDRSVVAPDPEFEQVEQLVNDLL